MKLKAIFILFLIIVNIFTFDIIKLREKLIELGKKRVKGTILENNHNNDDALLFSMYIPRTTKKEQIDKQYNCWKAMTANKSVEKHELLSKFRETIKSLKDLKLDKLKVSSMIKMKNGSLLPADKKSGKIIRNLFSRIIVKIKPFVSSFQKFGSTNGKSCLFPKTANKFVEISKKSPRRLLNISAFLAFASLTCYAIAAISLIAHHTGINTLFYIQMGLIGVSALFFIGSYYYQYRYEQLLREIKKEKRRKERERLEEVNNEIQRQENEKKRKEDLEAKNKQNKDVNVNDIEFKRDAINDSSSLNIIANKDKISRPSYIKVDLDKDRKRKFRRH